MGQEKNKIVLRFERVSHHQLGLIEAHGKRRGKVPNVDRERTSHNEFLVGDENLVGIANSRIGQMQLENAERKIASLNKRRRTTERKALQAALEKAGDNPHRLADVIGWPWDEKNTRPFTEGVLSISHQWFLDETGIVADAQVDQFRTFALDYVRETFGDDLLYMRLDLDEKTPHVQFVIAPEHENPKTGRRELSHRRHSVFGRSEMRSFFDGIQGDEEHIGSYELLQDEAAAFAWDRGLDVERGVCRAALNRVRQEIGDEIMRREHVPPARGRELAAAIVADAEQKRRAAQLETAKTERIAAEANRERDAARSTKAGAVAYARAIEVGTEAIEDEQIVYRPAAEKKPEGLAWGPNAPKEEAAQKSLIKTLQPAFSWLVGFARRMLRLKMKEADLETRARQMELRDAEQRRRASVLAEQTKAQGRTVPAAVAALAGAERTPYVPDRVDDFPGAFAVRKGSDPKALQTKLDRMTNCDLRQAWAATSDACALVPRNVPIAGDFDRGCVVLEFAAGQRGYDLNTGKHAPARAKDPQRANLHTDQDAQVIRVIRRDRQRQRVLGD